MTTLHTTMLMMQQIMRNADIKTGRGFLDFFADRIKQATSQPTLMRAIERLGELVNVQVQFIDAKVFADFIKSFQNEDVPNVLEWLRLYPNAAAMLANIRDEAMFTEMIQTIELPVVSAQTGSVPPRTDFDIRIRMTCLSPLSHGGDTKAGNATLFRRMDVMAGNGAMLRLPFYAGNALRGILRDILADHLIMSLGLVPSKTRPPIALWFFHALYAGGSLEENSSAAKVMDKRMGANGAVKASGIREFRNILPSLSLLGTALGNRIIAGCLHVNDLRPMCRQWGTSDTDVSELMTWEFLTRREDHEEHEEHHGMIASTEVLKAGTTLEGGIDIDMHANDLERSALARGLTLLRDYGVIGAENRRGFGKVVVEYDPVLDPAVYDSYLFSRGPEILDYLNSLGVIERETVNAPGEPDSESASLF